jgi:hypothetical protein
MIGSLIMNLIGSHKAKFNWFLSIWNVHMGKKYKKEVPPPATFLRKKEKSI